MPITPWNGSPGHPTLEVELLAPLAFGAPGVDYDAPPLAANNGDLLFAVWSHYDNHTITAPAGWTLLGKRANPAPSLFNGALWVYAKVATGDLPSETWHLSATGAETAGGVLFAFPAKPALGFFGGYLDSALVEDDGSTPDLVWNGAPTHRLTFGGVGPSTGGDTGNGASTDTRDRLIADFPPAVFSDGVTVVGRRETFNPSPGATYTKSLSGAAWNSTFSVLVALTITRTAGWHINSIPIG